MTQAFVFPGQGSQALGMGRALAEAYPEARAVFAAVDDALGQKLSDLMWNGPEDELTLTENAQPALMAVSIAALRALEARGLVLANAASHVAGHSLGEYTALTAAGALQLEDTARLLKLRGRAASTAAPYLQAAKHRLPSARYIHRDCDRQHAMPHWPKPAHALLAHAGRQSTRPSAPVARFLSASIHLPARSTLNRKVFGQARHQRRQRPRAPQDRLRPKRVPCREPDCPAPEKQMLAS